VPDPVNKVDEDTHGVFGKAGTILATDNTAIVTEKNRRLYLLYSSLLWCWRRMERFRWTEREKNKEVLDRVKKERDYFYCYTVHVVESLNYYTNHCTYIKFIKFIYVQFLV